MVAPVNETPMMAPEAPPLSGPTLSAVAEHVAALRRRLGREPRVVALLGAGASASAGVPDWRSPGSGLYARIARDAAARGDTELAACPGLVFSLSHFRRDPSAFYRTVREHCLFPGPPGGGGEEEEGEEGDGDDDGKEGADQDGQDGQNDQDDNSQQQQQKNEATDAPPALPFRPAPTAAHHLLAALAHRGALLRAFTQNVDGLEMEAGCPDGQLVQAHGGFREAHCASCGAAASPYAVMEALCGGGGGEGGEEGEDEGDKGGAAAAEAPRCGACGERAVKPAVVLFGERLPARFHRLRLQDMPRCELLIVLGTALAVEPFAGLVSAPPPSCPRVLVNRCAVRVTAAANGDAGGFDFSAAGSGGGPCRDVAVLGECDDGCLALAEALGGAEMRAEVEAAWRRGRRRRR